MAQKSHSQVSHNRRFASAVFGERQTVRQKVLLPLWGQYRPVDDVLGMSASPPTPEVLLHSANRGDVPSLELRRDDEPYTHTLC